VVHAIVPFRLQKIKDGIVAVPVTGSGFFGLLLKTRVQNLEADSVAYPSELQRFDT
jgi:hypothetical protein